MVIQAFAIKGVHDLHQDTAMHVCCHTKVQCVEQIQLDRAWRDSLTLEKAVGSPFCHQLAWGQNCAPPAGTGPEISIGVG